VPFSDTLCRVVIYVIALELPKFHAIMRHCEKPFRRRLVTPINPDGA
jgi:hypothetical protein